MTDVKILPESLSINTQKYVRISTYFQLLAVSYGLHFKQDMLKQHMENGYTSYVKIVLFLKF